jgi:hypothetical protein
MKTLSMLAFAKSHVKKTWKEFLKKKYWLNKGDSDAIIFEGDEK